MSESAGRVVAWQLRHVGATTGEWAEASEAAFREKTHADMGYEYRALVPEQLLVDCEREFQAHIINADHNTNELIATIDRLHTAESKLSAVRALADELYDGFLPHPTIAQIKDIASQLRALTEKSEETR